MSSQEQYTEYTQQRQNLAQYDLDYLKLRLDTQKLHKDILNFLQGTTSIIKFDDKTQQYYESNEVTGVALANNIGIQSLLSFVVAIINPHTIQGNTESQKDLNKILEHMELGLVERLTQHYDYWGIDEDDRDHIIDLIMFMSQMVLSRTINNLERPSYTPTIEKTSKYYANGKDKKVI